ncbi:MAG: hypothetical protein IPF46_07030 [Saprospiraceae bacterium]|nr:hypothetical protein [Candidatus Vicinibacter affinis]MBK6574032.1 hypothetical protein [Candidatus Vicinibacter affinis]MBK7302281.1 hypothetical protein [Candidatus Vicinibacter affinis]MBK7798239.1 hypothetical protein [Candidatus Vicinibacter affinis]MBK8404750.1 hypothetical protein [Candidatus Vicinibacter affinis]
MQTKPILILFLINLLTPIIANSQFSISNLSEIAKIKSGTTYIAMKDPNSEKTKEYIEVFKNYWTISKAEFIKYSEIEKYLSPENSFLTIGGYETNTEFTRLYQNGSQKHGINYSNTHIFLELWTCDKKYFTSKKKNKIFGNGDKIQVARIELFTDFETLSNPDLLYQSEFDGNGHIRNWGPGVLKNYVQALMGYLAKNESHSLYTGSSNAKELKKLKKESLYIPEYVLTKFNKFNGNETKKHDEKDIFEDFKLKYILLSGADLNHKILTDTTGFYYLIYIKSSTDKYINVIHSLTGEIIYSKYKPLSYNIKSDDFQDLQEKI